MSEIEKLYENANIKPKPLFSTRYGYEEGNYIMPVFTAEKQLRIVKLILFSKWWLNLKRLQFSEKFDEGLAQMINELWQDLTEEEKTNIRRILE